MRKILVAIVALMTSLSAIAGDIDLFFKGGATISKFNLEGSENRMGVAAGLGGKFLISDSRFFIMPEAMYVQKGQDNMVVYNDELSFLPVLYHMIEVPIVFGAQFDLPVKDLRLGFGAGPYISYDYRFNVVDDAMKYAKSANKYKGLSHGDVGLTFTLEFHYKRLMVFYDYDLGLRDITQRTLNTFDQSLNHRSMRIGAGYTFPRLNVSKQRKKAQM